MADIAPLIGEPLAIDLVNTRPSVPGGPVDLLATPTDLGRWLALEADRIAGFLPKQAAELSEDELAPIHAVRDHIASAIDCVRRGEAPPAAALQGLNEAMWAAPAVPELAWTGSSIATMSRRVGPFSVRLAAELAAAAAGLLCDPAVNRIRQCEAEDCVMLFLPAHARRRWCSAARCGNRVRVARYYRRHKTA